LVDDGFMYVTDTLSRVMKFDVRSGAEAIPLWRYDPKIRASRTTRGLAMYGNRIFLSTYDARLIALNRDNGEVVWEVLAAAPMDPATGTPSKAQAFSGAPLAIKTRGGRELLVQGESTGGSMGTRSWIGGFDLNTGQLVWRTFTIPAPGEPGSETWKDNHNAYRIGGASAADRLHDPATNLLISAPATPSRPSSTPNSAPAIIYTASISVDADTGKTRFFQET
jgi:alcohol dehydrogenase (cytochrome c)